jgi:hypothetical protein
MARIRFDSVKMRNVYLGPLGDDPSRKLRITEDKRIIAENLWPFGGGFREF